MSKITSGIALFSLLMALSLGVAFGEDVAETINVTENATNLTNATNVTIDINETNETVEIVEEATEEITEEAE